MKYTLSFIFICCILLCKAQTPFAYPGAHWCTVYAYPTATIYTETDYSKDTVIQGIPCSQTGAGCLFVRNDTVYRILGNGNVYFLYNYNAIAGDVWRIWVEPGYRFHFSDSLVPIRVDSASTRSIRGKVRRIIFTSIIDTPFYNYGYTLGDIVEGAGSSHHFLPGPWGFVDDGIPFRICFGDSLTGAFHEDLGNIQLLDSCVCHVWMGADNVKDSEQLNVVYDNHGNKLRITTLSDTYPVNVQIIDLSGQVVKSVTSYHNSFNIPVEEITRGIYFCAIKQHNHKVVKKIIVTE